MPERLFKICIYTFIMVVILVPNKVKISSIPISSDLFLGGMAILCFFIYAVKEIKKNHKLNDIFKDKTIRYYSFILIAFIALSLFSITYAKNKVSVITETMRFCEYVFLFYSIIIIADKKFIKNSLRLFYLVMVFAALGGLFQFIFNLSSFHASGILFNRGKIYSTFVNPNYWGAAVNLVIYYPIIRMIQKNTNEKKIYNLITFIILLANLLLTYTRGAWLGFAVGLIILGIIYYKKILYVVPVGIVSIFAVPSLRNRFISIFDLNNFTNDERFKLWKTGFIMFKDHFIKGVGNGNYLDMYGSYVKLYPQLYLQRDKFSVHNSYIKMFAELGIFGGIIFILIYVFLAYISYKCFKGLKNVKMKACALALTCFWGAYLFQNFFNNLMFIPQLNVFAWILSAMLYKEYLIEKKEELINE